MLKKFSHPVFCTALFGSLLVASPITTGAEQDIFIPADTLFYVGTGKPYRVESLFSLIPDFAEILDDSDSPRLGEVDEFLSDPSAVLSNWGIEDKVSFSMYTVGLSPVFRISLGDAKKFMRALQEYEAERELVAEEREHEDWKIRLYADLSDDPARNTTDEPKSATPVLVVGVSESEAVVGFLPSSGGDELINSVLGITKPEQSIEASGELKKLRKKWGYGEELASFINFQGIAAAVTDEDDRIGRQLQSSEFLSAGMRGYLQQMRSEPCRAEVTKLVSNWPMLVAGYRSLEVDDKQIEFDAHAALLIGNEQIRDTLKLFRGVLPSSQSSSEPILSLELGLTVDNLAQALGQLSGIASSINYQCQPLQPINALAAKDLTAASMGVVMFGGMARGVRGVSISLFDADFSLDQGASQFKNIDSAFTLSADNPAMLLGTLRMLPQLGALGDIPLDGSEISINSAIPLPLPAGVDVKAAVRGNNIVLFSGEQSTDFANRLAQNESEGFFRGKANTKLIVDKLLAVAEEAGNAKNTETAREILDNYLRGELSYSLEFTDNGVEVVNAGRVDRREEPKSEK